MNKKKEKMLSLPMEDLDLSPECKEFVKKLGFINLGALIDKGWAGVRAMDGFDYVRFNEIIKLLHAHDLVFLLESN